MFNSGRYYAQLMHDTMSATSKDFLNLLLARSEVRFEHNSLHILS